MKTPPTRRNNVPTEAGTYFTTFHSGFGSTPDHIIVRNGTDGLEFISLHAVEWKPFTDFWGLEEWEFSDKLEEEDDPQGWAEDNLRKIAAENEIKEFLQEKYDEED